MSYLSSDALSLGVVRRTIAPPIGLELVGYPEGRPNTGVEIDLCVRAAVFGTAGMVQPRAAIVVIDTLGVHPNVVRQIRDGAARAVPGLAGESVMVVATHTHSAPASSDMRLGGQEVQASPAYVQQIIAASIDALAAAWNERSEVRLRVGRTELRLGHNRRVVDTSGKAINDWIDPEGRHTGFFNPNVRILSFDDTATGRPRAIVSLYGCHPVTLARNTLASADYPGYFIAATETAIAGCQVIHLTGAAADINPREKLSPDPSMSRRFGEALSCAVLEELPHARTINAVPISTHTRRVAIDLAPNARANYARRAFDSIDGKTVTTELQVLRLGEVALITAPGELFAATGVAIENTSPFPTTFVVGYANDNLGYLVPHHVLREGAYEADSPITHQTEDVLLPEARAILESARNTG